MVGSAVLSTVASSMCIKTAVARSKGRRRWGVGWVVMVGFFWGVGLGSLKSGVGWKWALGCEWMA